MRRIHADLPFEPKDRPRDEYLGSADAGVVEQIACREGVSRVDDDAIICDQRKHIVGIDAGLHRHDCYLGIDGTQMCCSRVYFWDADIGGRMDDLALQIADIDHVVIHDTQRADPCCRKVERHW